MKVGTDCIGVSVFALVINNEGKVLLELNKSSEKKGSAYNGVWSLPGGAVEFGERAEEALAREIKEETNIDIEDVKLFSFSDYIVPEENKHWLALYFTARAKSGKIKNHEPEKFEKVEFVNPKNQVGKFSKFCEAILRENELLR